MKLYLIILSAILVIYFCFSSGMVFEAAKVKSISRFEAPYNVVLSDSRIDLWGNYTQDDVKVREWIMHSPIDPIYSDMYGIIFLQEYMSYEKKVYFLPEDMEVPAGSFVFLRSWSNTNHELTFWTGSGTRKNVEFFGYQGDTLFQVGESKVMEVK